MAMKKLKPSKISKMVAEMPAFPRSVQEVLVLTNDINCAPRELVRVVEHDPILTGRMLKLVNSAYFGLSRRIDSVKEAVAFIGLNTLKHLALSVAAVGSLPKKNKAGLKMDEFLGHSLAVAATSRLIAKRFGLGTRDSDNLFLSGLLHRIGQVVLALHVPKAYKAIRQRAKERGIPEHELEEQVLGITHFEIGALVASKWKLLDKNVEAIRHYWSSPPEVERTVWMDGLFCAVWLVHEIEFNETPAHLVAPEATLEALAKRLRFPPQDLMSERHRIEDAIAKTRVFEDL